MATVLTPTYIPAGRDSVADYMQLFAQRHASDVQAKTARLKAKFDYLNTVAEATLGGITQVAAEEDNRPLFKSLMSEMGIEDTDQDKMIDALAQTPMSNKQWQEFIAGFAMRNQGLKQQEESAGGAPAGAELATEQFLAAPGAANPTVPTPALGQTVTIPQQRMMMSAPYAAAIVMAGPAGSQAGTQRANPQSKLKLSPASALAGDKGAEQVPSKLIGPFRLPVQIGMASGELFDKMITGKSGNFKREFMDVVKALDEQSDKTGQYDAGNEVPALNTLDRATRLAQLNQAIASAESTGELETARAAKNAFIRQQYVKDRDTLATGAVANRAKDILKATFGEDAKGDTLAEVEQSLNNKYGDVYKHLSARQGNVKLWGNTKYNPVTLDLLQVDQQKSIADAFKQPQAGLAIQAGQAAKDAVTDAIAAATSGKKGFQYKAELSEARTLKAMRKYFAGMDDAQIKSYVDKQVELFGGLPSLVSRVFPDPIGVKMAELNAIIAQNIAGNKQAEATLRQRQQESEQETTLRREQNNLQRQNIERAAAKDMSEAVIRTKADADKVITDREKILKDYVTRVKKLPDTGETVAKLYKEDAQFKALYDSWNAAQYARFNLPDENGHVQGADVIDNPYEYSTGLFNWFKAEVRIPAVIPRGVPIPGQQQQPAVGRKSAQDILKQVKKQ